MTLDTKKIKTLISEDLYKLYPFPYKFAYQLFIMDFFPFGPYSSAQFLLNCDSVLKLLIFCAANQEDINLKKENFLFYSNPHDYEGSFFIKNEILYYFPRGNDVYFNLNELKYHDLMVSSILLVFPNVLQTDKSTAWNHLYTFLLESYYEETLYRHLKQKNIFKHHRDDSIKYLIHFLNEEPRRKKKYEKKTLLNLLNLFNLEMNLVPTKNLIKNYVSVFKKPNVFIEYLEKQLNN